MNKADLIEAVASETGMSKADAGRAVSAVFDSITKAVAGGSKFSMPGFGSLEGVARNARVCRDPRTGASINVAATTVVKFRVAKAFKEEVAK